MHMNQGIMNHLIYEYLYDLPPSLSLWNTSLYSYIQIDTHTHSCNFAKCHIMTTSKQASLTNIHQTTLRKSPAQKLGKVTNIEKVKSRSKIGYAMATWTHTSSGAVSTSSSIHQLELASTSAFLLLESPFKNITHRYIRIIRNCLHWMDQNLVPTQRFCWFSQRKRC